MHLIAGNLVYIELPTFCPENGLFGSGKAALLALAGQNSWPEAEKTVGQGRGSQTSGGSTVADLILRVESSSELDGIQYLKQLAKNGVGSAHSQRAYETAIEEFIAWSLHNGKIRINASQLRAYQAHLTGRTPHHNHY